MTAHDLLHDLGRTAFAMGMGRRFGRGPGHHRGRHGGGEFWGWGSWPGDRPTRRGDVKFEILEVVAEQPRHGYDVIRSLGERRGGPRPSAGSVYPTLQMLEDEGCLTSEMVDGKRVYTITAEGRQLLEQRPQEEPDDEDAGHERRRVLREAAFKLGAAVWQAAHEDNGETVKRVREILNEARKEIYDLLGESD